MAEKDGKTFLTQKQIILTGEKRAEHTFAGLNTQHLSTTVENCSFIFQTKNFFMQKEKTEIRNFILFGMGGKEFEYVNARVSTNLVWK